MRIKLYNSKKAQEEIVGFVVILVIVSIIILILLWFLLNRSEDSAVESFEIESFIQTALQYTSSCEGNLEFLPVEELIISCEEKNKCLGGEDSCIILEETFKKIIDSSWVVSNQSSLKGYKLNVYVDKEEKLVLKKGNETSNYKGALQDFARSGTDYTVTLNIYY